MRRGTWQEAVEYLKTFNRERGYMVGIPCQEHTSIIVVFTNDSFKEDYPLESRSYKVSNDNKAFLDGMMGYSIFAGSLDGSDPCVRLEGYMEEEGNPGGWKVEYCEIPND